MAFISKQFNTFNRFSLTTILCVSFGCFSVIFSSVNFSAHAGENYAFKVKVKNNTGKKIRVLFVQWQPKGASKYKWNNCDIDLALNAGHNKTLTCSTRASVKKWRRRFEMAGYCYNDDGTSPNEKAPSAYFPLTKKWFSRSWAVDRNNTYTLSFKKDQFRCD